MESPVVTSAEEVKGAEQPVNALAVQFRKERGAYQTYLNGIEEKLNAEEVPLGKVAMQVIADKLVIVPPREYRKTFKKIQGVDVDIQRDACLMQIQKTYLALVSILIKLASSGVKINDASLALLKDQASLDQQVKGVESEIIAQTTRAVKNKLNGTTPIIPFWEGLMQTGVLRALITRENLPVRFLNRVSLALEYLAAKDQSKMEAKELDELISLDDMLKLVGDEENDVIRQAYFKTILPRVLELDAGDYEPRKDHLQLLAARPPKGLELTEDYIDIMITYYQTKIMQFEKFLPTQDDSILPQAWLSEQKQKGHSEQTFLNLIKLENLIEHLAKSNPKKMEALLKEIIHLYAKIAKNGYMIPRGCRLIGLVKVQKFHAIIGDLILKTPYAVDQAAILAIMGVGLKELVYMANKKMLLMNTGRFGKVQGVSADVYRASLIERVMKSDDTPHKARVIYWWLGYNSMMPKPMVMRAGKRVPELDFDCSLSGWLYYTGFPQGITELAEPLIQKLEIALRAMGVKRIQECDPREVISLTLSPGMQVAQLISDHGTPRVCTLLRTLLSDEGVKDIPQYFRELKSVDSNDFEKRVVLVNHFLPYIYEKCPMYDDLKALASEMPGPGDRRWGLIQTHLMKENFYKVLNLLITAERAYRFIDIVTKPFLCQFILTCLNPENKKYTLEEKRQTIAPHLMRWVVKGDKFEIDLQKAIDSLPALALEDAQLPAAVVESADGAGREPSKDSENSTRLTS